MSTSLLFRQAKASDIPFLVEAIIAAEKSGTDRLSSATIYDLEEPEVERLLSEMLDEEIGGQELCFSSFHILESEEKPAATMAVWIEGEEGSSSVLRSALLAHYIPMDNLKKAMAFRPVFTDLRMDRTEGSLQMESIYVAPEERGKGHLSALIKHISAQYKGKTKRAELQVDGENIRAIKAYEKIGFRISLERQSDKADALRILPSNKKCAMTLDL
jgi:ribosomal protein S18 acetylase RimI-like enzyme